jgi:CheY-like chemotaxis protein
VSAARQTHNGMGVAFFAGCCCTHILWRRDYMKYKALLIGGNHTIVDDFFMQLFDEFESLTTSTRYEDIVAHIKHFKPDVFVYCLANESRDTFNRIVSLKNQFSSNNVPVVIIGSEDDCNDFMSLSSSMVELVLTKPITALQIGEKLVKFLEKRKQQQEELRREEELKKAEERKKDEELTGASPALGEESNRRRHVLVVDDDPVMLKVIKEYLKDKYDVATAVSGRIALKFLENKHTDLILLDYEMPVEDGPFILSKIRANDSTKDIPVIFLTGITDSDKIKKVLVMKPQGYLLKPINGDKLLSTIHNIFSK